MSKSPKLYVTIMAVWLLLFGSAVLTSYSQIGRLMHVTPLSGFLVTITLAFIGYFWLNGVKDVLYTAWYYLFVRSHRITLPYRPLLREPLVLLVYCTRNDFNGDSLGKSMRQLYGNVRTVILDDSDKEMYLRQVDEFAATNQVEVVRRIGRVGFKAGNLNNFLCDAEYDFFVILDSDEVIPPGFIRRMLDYFAANKNTGVVQANHIATRNITPFQRKFAIGVDSHWPVYQTVKDEFGFLSLLGHGAMVSRECYEAAGGFPLVVAEDICFSLAAREAGYMTVFAPDVTCEEEYPPDYLAFRKRHNKWTQGNMEFIRRNTWPILASRQLKWYEKLDIVLFTYALPLTAVFSLFIVINVVVLPLVGTTFQYPLWMLAPTLLFLLAPMANDVIFHWKAMSKRKLFSYSGGSMLLYGSMYYTSLKASLKSMFGKSVFLVTPKNAERVSFREALTVTRGEWIFALAIMTIAIVCTGSIFPVLLLAVPALSASYLSVRHQPTRKEMEDVQFLEPASH